MSKHTRRTIVYNLAPAGAFKLFLLNTTQGMHMGFGGNPYGPAGTGKTESVKALGQAFGRQVRTPRGVCGRGSLA